MNDYLIRKVAYSFRIWLTKNSEGGKKWKPEFDSRTYFYDVTAGFLTMTYLF